MKCKYTLYLCLAFLCSFVHLNAQNDQYKNAFNLDLGLSGLQVGILYVNEDDLVNYGFDTTGVTDLDGIFSYKVPLAIQLSYDRALARKLSFGVHFSYQQVGFDISNLTYTERATLVTRNINFTSLDINRLDIGGRILFHYANRRNMDLYTGLRIGVAQLKSVATSNDVEVAQSLENSRFNGTTSSFQFILFGLRGYFKGIAGLNFELALGGPHFFAFGINYRL